MVLSIFSELATAGFKIFKKTYKIQTEYDYDEDVGI